MIDCNEYLALLHRFWDGPKFSQSQEDEMEKHANSCEMCCAASEQFFVELFDRVVPESEKKFFDDHGKYIRAELERRRKCLFPS